MQMLAAVLLASGGTVVITSDIIDKVMNGDWEVSKTHDKHSNYTFEIKPRIDHKNQLPLNLPNPNTGD